ncbi:MAG: hypothetical protein RBS39_07625 [Phycisphaerales bacterium]|nr:hypothetical protein [Phycisphaerales bacterium]
MKRRRTSHTSRLARLRARVVDVVWAVVILAFSLASQGWVPGSGAFGGQSGHNVWARCGSSMCACESNVPLAEHRGVAAFRQKLCPLCPDDPADVPCDRDEPSRDDRSPAFKPLLVLAKSGGLGVACPTDLASMGVSLCLLGLSRPSISVECGPEVRSVACATLDSRPESLSLAVPEPPPRA